MAIDHCEWRIVSVPDSDAHDRWRQTDGHLIHQSDPIRTEHLEPLSFEFPADSKGEYRVELTVEDEAGQRHTALGRVLAVPYSDYDLPQLLVESYSANEESNREGAAIVSTGDTLKFDASSFGMDTGEYLEWRIKPDGERVTPLPDAENVELVEERNESLLRELRFEEPGYTLVEVDADIEDSKFERPGNLPTSDAVWVHVVGQSELSVSIESPVETWIYIPVEFTAVVDDADEESLEYEWSGDVSGTGRTIEQSFLETGTKQITVDVTDEAGETSSATMEFEVRGWWSQSGGNGPLDGTAPVDLEVTRDV